MTEDAAPVPAGRDGRTVLVVCTANLCRSPMIEALLAHALGEHGGRFAISSAGARATDGLPIHPLAGEVLAARGVDAGAFRSRALQRGHVTAADLVLTAERAHAAAVLALDPGALHLTFTLGQFARLLRAAPDDEIAGDGLEVLVDRARRARSRSEPGDDDLADPIGQPRRRFEATATRIEELVEPIAAAMSRLRSATP